jgi:hypothetical protein
MVSDFTERMDMFREETASEMKEIIDSQETYARNVREEIKLEFLVKQRKRETELTLENLRLKDEVEVLKMLCQKEIFY